MGNDATLAIISPSEALQRSVETRTGRQSDHRVVLSSGFEPRLQERLRELTPRFVILDAAGDERAALSLLAWIQHHNACPNITRPIHVILVSAFTPGVVAILADALERGHFDHVLLPAELERTAAAHAVMREQIAEKVGRVIVRHCGKTPSQPDLPSVAEPDADRSQPQAPLAREAILIGCSTGGPEALRTILPPLCEAVETPIFIVQHIGADFSGPMADLLDHRCRHTVQEVTEDRDVAPGHVYIAPGGRHMLLGRAGDRARLVLSDAPPEDGCRPSANILFRSAPLVYGSAAIGVILSGMGRDGTEGALALKQARASVFAQDEASSVVWGMPGSAVAAGAVDKVVPLQDLAVAIETQARNIAARAQPSARRKA
jgi:two-component system chemotaxis response regulator CheB